MHLNNWSLRTRFIAIALAISIPLTGLAAVWFMEEFWAQRAQAAQEVREAALRVAEQVGYSTQGLWRSLNMLARTPAVQAHDPKRTAAFLRDLLPAAPHFDDLYVFTRDGTLVASARSSSAPHPSVWLSGGFQEAIRAGLPATSEVLAGRDGSPPSAYLAVPIRFGNRQVTGSLVARLNLAEVGRWIGTSRPGASIGWAVVDSHGLILLHEEPQAWLGKSLDASPGVLRADFIVPGTTWWAVTMMPEAVVGARLQTKILVVGVPLIAILLFVGTVGLGIARSTWRPLKALAASVRQIGAGQSPTFLPSTVGGGEIGEVARAFQDTFGSLTRRQQELTALLQATQALTSTLDLDRILQAIVDQAAAISGTSVVRLFLLDESTRVLRLRVGRGLPPDIEQDIAIPVGESFSGQVAATGQPVAVADCRQDPRLRYPDHAEQYGLISYLGLPVQLGDKPVGVLVFNTPEPTAYREDEITFLSAFARQAALAIHNARSYGAEQARRKQLEAMRDVVAEITRELDIPRLLALIQRGAMDLLRAGAGSLYLWDESMEALTLQASHGAGSIGAPSHRLGEGIIGTVAQRRQGLIVNEYRSSLTGLRQERTRIGAVLAEPLLYRDRLLGVVGVSDAGAGRQFTEEDRHILTLFAHQAAIALENARLFAETTQSYESLRRAQDELVRSEKLRGLGQMAAGIAHDLNNTLAAILGQVELLRMRVVNPDILEALATLETTASDGAHVVRRLQDFARQRTRSALGSVDLTRAIQDALEITRPRWRDEAQRDGRRVEIRTVWESVPAVFGHAAEIREVLTNLIFNAVDAMPQGGTITLAAPPGAHGQSICRFVNWSIGWKEVGSGDHDDSTGCQSGRVAPLRRVGRGDGQRHRRGDDRRGAAADLRSLLHHEGDAGQRPWAFRGVRHHGTARWKHQCLKCPRSRHNHHPPVPGRHAECRSDPLVCAGPCPGPSHSLDRR